MPGDYENGERALVSVKFRTREAKEDWFELGRHVRPRADNLTGSRAPDEISLPRGLTGVGPQPWRA